MESEDIISAGNAVDGTDSGFPDGHGSAFEDNNEGIIAFGAAVEGKSFVLSVCSLTRTI